LQVDEAEFLHAEALSALESISEPVVIARQNVGSLLSEKKFLAENGGKEDHKSVALKSKVAQKVQRFIETETTDSSVSLAGSDAITTEVRFILQRPERACFWRECRM
jgi:hypothetical protein